MKKIIYFFSALVLLLNSCSHDIEPNMPPSDNPTNPSNPTTSVLLKKMIQTDSDGFTNTLNFTYSGNKLVKITYSEDNTYEVFTYNGDLIAKSESFDSSNNMIDTFTYVYNVDGNLIEAKWLDYVNGNDASTKFLYTHNADGTISYQQFNGDTNSQTTFYRDGKIYANKFEENVPADPGYYPDHVVTHTFTYDGKNQPTKNITGHGKIWFAFSDSGTNFQNNVTSNVHTNTLGLYQPMTTTSYTYNNLDYPITQTETSSSDPTDVTTTQYFYE